MTKEPLINQHVDMTRFEKVSATVQATCPNCGAGIDHSLDVTDGGRLAWACTKCGRVSQSFNFEARKDYND